MEYPTSLLAVQEDLEARFSRFVRSLDSSCIITLRELLEDPAALLKLQAPWVNYDLLKKAILNTDAFLCGCSPHPRISGYGTIVFFQSASDEDDWKAFQDRLETMEGYRERYEEIYGKDVPPQVYYLHTSPKWNYKLTGPWNSRNRKIFPLWSFTNWGNFREILGTWEGTPGFRGALGYQIPNLPNILQVSQKTATIYLARILTHDIGHDYCPTISPDDDSLHNAMTIQSMGIHAPALNADPWERLMYRECSDPYFFLDARDDIDACNTIKLTPLQQYLLRIYKRWYTSTAHWERVEKLWGVSRFTSIQDARARVDFVIRDMCSNGFLQYGNHD